MQVVDITIVGSGVASSLTLIEVFQKLIERGPSSHKPAITIIEKTPELWKGIPYGKRSSVNALTITSVLDFIYEPERPAFFAWLKATKDEWAAWYRECGGTTAARWLQNNLPLIDNNAWEHVYIPRFLYGNYLKKKVTGLLHQVEELQLADVRFVHAEAIDVNPAADGNYKVSVEHADNTTGAIITRKLVIATGSAPVKNLCGDAIKNVAYVNDIYDPETKENLHLLHHALTKAREEKDRNVLIIGSNASSIEILYLLEGIPEIRSLLNKIVIISTSGALPVHISTEKLAEHPTPHLDGVAAPGGYNIKTLAEAAGKDIQLALANGANMDYVAAVVGKTLKLMDALDEQARKEFYGIYGLKLRDSFRRSGPEYKGGAQVLIDAAQVTVLKGRFMSFEPAESGVLLHYTNTATGLETTYPLPFAVVVNCTGSSDLDVSSSRLLFNLTNKGICRMNLSCKGFEVNEKFEAAPNLYIMGPLLGGNVNKLIHFWQLENAARLTYLAPFLAAELVG